MARFFGQYLLEKGLLSREQLLEAISRQRSKTEKLGELAIKKGYISPVEVEVIRQEQQHVDLFFGELAVKLGYLSLAQVNELLNMQRASHVFLGEIIAKLGYLTEAAVQHELEIFRKDEGDSPENFESLSLPEGAPHGEVLKLVADLARKHFRRVGDLKVKIFKAVEEATSLANPFIGSSIDVKGDLGALLLLRVSDQTASYVVEHFGSLSGMEKNPELLKDAIAEFFNIFCGNLMTKFLEIGKSCDISVPNTYLESEMNSFAVPAGKRAFTLPIHTPEGSASITLISA